MFFPTIVLEEGACWVQITSTAWMSQSYLWMDDALLVRIKPDYSYHTVFNFSLKMIMIKLATLVELFRMIP